MDDTESAGTSGTGRRPGRLLEEPLVTFDLAEELGRLEREPEGNDPDRSSITLTKAGSLRLVLTSLREDAVLGGNDTEGTLALLVLRGRLTVVRDSRTESIAEQQVAVIDPGGPWRARADTNSSVLLTISWPEREGEIGF